MFELIRKLLEEQKEVWVKGKYWENWFKVSDLENDMEWVCILHDSGYLYLGEFEIIGIHIGDPTKEG